jgi:hypothetical protein
MGQEDILNFQYYLYEINEYLADCEPHADTIKETLSSATNTFLQCQKNITSTYFLHVCRKIYKLIYGQGFTDYTRPMQPPRIGPALLLCFM